MAAKGKPTAAPRQTVLWVAIAVLVMACAALTSLLVFKDPGKAKQPSISLGTMQYEFKDGRATERDDPAVQALRTFLKNEAERSGCPADAPAYEHVAAYTKDETQVFLRYGCGAADSPIYAVKTGDTWEMLSPTNHFNHLGIPECQYLADNNISTEIAPVCVDTAGDGTATYSVR